MDESGSSEVTAGTSCDKGEALRTVLWDRGDFWDEISATLEAKGVCRVVHRISWEGKGDAHADDFYSGKFLPARLTGCAVPLLEDLRVEIPTFLDMNWRNLDRDVTGQYSEKTLDDHLNLFHLYADYFADLLVRLSVDLVLFNRPPHLGADYLLYAVAQGMGVRTIVLQQLLIPNSFMICERSEGMGIIGTQPVVSEREPVRLDRTHEKELFYMKRPGILSGYAGVVRDRAARRGREAGPLDFCNPVNGAAFLWWKMDLNVKSRLVKDLVCRRRRGQALFRYYREMQYRRDLAEATVDTIDLDRPFVYFPLHMQPERTTSASGGDYVDQVLAIERLAAWLPDDWLIVVKEHPVQTSYMRGPWFFKRLALTKQARLVSRKFDTITLTKNARFVATITGTVGWEAITGGKCAVVFGEAWYRGLPGAFDFSPELLLEEVLEFEIDHEDLEKRVYEMLIRCGKGVVASSYAVQIEGFDRAANAETAARSLQSYLEKGLAGCGRVRPGVREVAPATGEK